MDVFIWMCLSAAKHIRGFAGAIALLIILASAATLWASAPQAGVAIEGTVVDIAGHAVAGATVLLEAKDGSSHTGTKTNAGGSFVIFAPQSGTYQLSANKSGLHSRVIDPFALPAENRKHITLILEASGTTDAVEFSDQPNFTVAGVTDWTAAGGHGSDASLRTSEALTRDILTLKPASPKSDTSTSDSATSDSAQEHTLRAALTTAPDSFEANHQLGEFYLQRGRYRDAIPPLQKAYRLDPSHRENAYALAVAYGQAGDLSSTRELIHTLLAHQDEDKLHRLLGELDEKLGDPLAAVHEYAQAVHMNPSEQNYFDWGSELLLHRAVWQAKDVFEQGVKAYPQSARMLAALGAALFAGARYDEAASRLCQASDLNPADSEPYIFLGKIETAAPAPLPCVEQKLARFVKQQPDHALANYYYAMAILKRQEHLDDRHTLQMAESLLTKAITIDSQCSDAYLQLGIMNVSQHNFEKAIDLYTKAIDANPRSSEAHYRLGVAYDRVGEPEKARQEFQRHDEIEKLQAADVERQRREIKQFSVVTQSQPTIH